jgi:hypothetical protein
MRHRVVGNAMTGEEGEKVGGCRGHWGNVEQGRPVWNRGSRGSKGTGHALRRL